MDAMHWILRLDGPLIRLIDIFSGYKNNIDSAIYELRMFEHSITYFTKCADCEFKNAIKKYIAAKIHNTLIDGAPRRIFEVFTQLSKCDGNFNMDSIINELRIEYDKININSLKNADIMIDERLKRGEFVIITQKIRIGKLNEYLSYILMFMICHDIGDYVSRDSYAKGFQFSIKQILKSNCNHPAFSKACDDYNCECQDELKHACWAETDALCELTRMYFKRYYPDLAIYVEYFHKSMKDDREWFQSTFHSISHLKPIVDIMINLQRDQTSSKNAAQKTITNECS